MPLLSALQQYNVNVYAVSRSINDTHPILSKLGVRQLVQPDTDSPDLPKDKQLFTLAQEIGGFDYVIDPFFDVYLPKVLIIMNPGSKYVTCGAAVTWEEDASDRLRTVMANALLRNVTLIANCVGQTGDLASAIRDYTAGSFDVMVDSIFEGEDISAFFERTYCAPDRLGKVVYKYSYDFKWRFLYNWYWLFVVALRRLCCYCLLMSMLLADFIIVIAMLTSIPMYAEAVHI